MGLPKRAQRTMDTKCTERIRREYNERHSNHRGNGQETSQENEELDSTWERSSTRILDKASGKLAPKKSTITQSAHRDSYHLRMAEYRKNNTTHEEQEGWSYPKQI